MARVHVGLWTASGRVWDRHGFMVGVPQKRLRQEQIPVVVLVTDARPVALIVTTRS
jgi:hypothetical protein